MTNPRLRESDRQIWTAATWAAPFVVQIVVGVAIAATWMVGRYGPDVHGFSQYVIGVSVMLLVAVVVGGPLLASRSPRAKGLAVSVFGASGITIVGGVVYGAWVVGW